MNSRCVCLAFVALALVSAGWAEENKSPGYLVTFYLKGSECEFSSAALIGNYFQNRRLAEVDDWTVCLEDEAGDIIWQAAFTNPAVFSPILRAEQPIPFTLQIPSRPAAHAFVLRDQRGGVRFRRAFDEEFIGQASANRAHFLRAASENREMIARLRRQSPSRGGALRPAENPVEPGDWFSQNEVPELLERWSQGGTESDRRHEAFDFPSSSLQDAPSFNVRGVIKSFNGTTVGYATILLRHLASTTAVGRYWRRSAGFDGHFIFGVTSSLCPSWFVVTVNAPGYIRESALVWISGDVTLDLVLKPGNTVSGIVTDAAGEPVNQARVRAYQGDAFVNSALTKQDGSYSLELGSGVYDLRVLPPDAAPYAPASLEGVEIKDSRNVDFVLPPGAGLLVVRLFYPDEQAYLLTQAAPKRFEIERAGRLLMATRSGKGAPAFDEQKGRYFVPYSLFLDTGEYDLTCYPLGHTPVRIREIHVTGKTTIDCDLGSAFTWSGVLRGADGKPLPSVDVRSYDDITGAYVTVKTDAEGRFTVPITPNGYVKFSADEDSRNILYVERLGRSLQNRLEDCILDDFPSFTDSGWELTQIYGVDNRDNRVNIVILGDGYTGVRETYADQNGNGQWDGYLFYDLDNDGAWNTGEPYQGYGDRRDPPLPGTNPTLANEPFQDLNQDGVPNLDDQALFDRNSLDLARSILGQDLWRDHKDVLNIFRVRVISKQAGHDILDQAGKVIIARDTALGSRLSDPDRRYLMSAESGAVNYWSAIVPERDVRIVLINQPIPMGRGNSAILLGAGCVTGYQNRETVAHELGHNLGYLHDEYSEFESGYTGNELVYANVTTQSEPDLIPWRFLLTPGKEIPSVPGSCGIGLFEGAAYYTGGVYRPTQNCLMVNGSRLCPICRQAIEIRLARLTRQLPAPLPLSPAGVVTTLRPAFRWEPTPGVSHWYLEIQPVDEGGTSEMHDVYGTWFQTSTAFRPGVVYRWRLSPGSEEIQGTYSDWVYFHARSREPRGPGR